MIEIDPVESGIEIRRFDDHVLQDSDKVFVELDQPTLLSDMLHRLEKDGCPEDVQDAVVLRVLEQFDPEDEADDFEVSMYEKDALSHDRIFGDELIICPKQSPE